MENTTNLSGFQHPMALGSSRNWLRLLLQNRGVDSEYRRRAAEITVMSLLTMPLRWYERLRYNAAVELVELNKPPIFIVGHWRSGTTHLHNLMAQDPQFGYISTFQAFAPATMFTAEALLGKQLAVAKPMTRPMDNMIMSAASPQEEDMALASLTDQTSYHQWWFARRADTYFERYALLEGLSAEEYRRWQTTYRWLLKKLTLRYSGRQLVLKNPPNTGRIKALRDTFPGAKFVHMYRNPYDVFVSTKHLYRKAHPLIRFQTPSEGDDERRILKFYRLMMHKFLAERAEIPAEDLVEVRFEDLERDPLGEVRRIYQALSLPGWEQAEPAMRAYTATLGDYRKNHFELDSRVIELVNRHWAFAFERWEYPMQHTIAVPV